nr:MAG TPA: hypothetical protein [Caudoviricetes sp.]
MRSDFSKSHCFALFSKTAGRLKVSAKSDKIKSHWKVTGICIVDSCSHS